ncbi:hypothetical protein VK792_12835 [Mesobacterium sp. TK19101]|uniref:EamA domain-containing protein n=1 Tax=Mesobacterium hydrothermale TaxID=3111907 RepID=A0ABU6HI77_9RHOB|nr:hypothetical protein [Mesobacterium sp. TK19101]MEC3862172.1 hypothetical protein [Mesobacterium sp. TK19101]
MSGTVFAIVLLAAVMHAGWNALVKASGDRLALMGLISVGHVLPALALVPFVPLPGWESVPYIAASTAIHWGYYWLLTVAYRLGDLSLVYPIARGSAPLLVALGAQIFTGEHLPPLAWAGVGVVSLGIFLLALRPRGGALPLSGMGAAALVALLITAYSIVDGTGVRLPQMALSYVVWLFIGEILFAAWALWVRRAALPAISRRGLWIGIAGGVVSATAYALALWAKTQAPIGMVSALRETSVLIAALIGVIAFGERPVGIRLLSGGVVCVGAALLAVA